jgi:hypothetical protein
MSDSSIADKDVVDDRPVGYYLMHSDYPGGRTEDDPSIQQTYEVLSSLSESILHATLVRMGKAEDRFRDCREEFESLEAALDKSSAASNDIEARSARWRGWWR